MRAQLVLGALLAAACLGPALAQSPNSYDPCQPITALNKASPAPRAACAADTANRGLAMYRVTLLCSGWPTILAAPSATGAPPRPPAHRSSCS